MFNLRQRSFLGGIEGLACLALIVRGAVFGPPAYAQLLDGVYQWHCAGLNRRHRSGSHNHAPEHGNCRGAGYGLQQRGELRVSSVSRLENILSMPPSRASAPQKSRPSSSR